MRTLDIKQGAIIESNFNQSMSCNGPVTTNTVSIGACQGDTVYSWDHTN
jgi:hypothetical protein